MCGHCGYTRVGREVSSEIVESMKEALLHRGPDGHGTYADEDVVLGHRRLSIIDLSGGQQPMANEDGSIVVVTNGEIYNYRELMSELEAKGHVFQSRSDTEVLLHLYEAHGEKMFGKLDGMFSFALWDAGKKRLLLARDRYGKKPLYYAERNGQIIFASELKALVRHPWIQKKVDRTALSRYLAFEYVPAPLSIYEGVYKLDAGSFLMWGKGKFRIERYWDYPLEAPPFRGSEEECCGEIRRLLGDAVRKRLVSDVPLGVFLSGGIDSSSVVALMAEHVPGKIKTFCIGFEEASYDESAYARDVARYFGTDHHEERLTPGKLLEVLPEVSSAFDEPFADASAIPTFLLSKFTREHVTVALGGDGGDELFAGYDPFVAHRYAKLVLMLPEWMRKGICRVSELLPTSDANMSFEFRMKRFMRHLVPDPVHRNHLWMGAYTLEMQRTLFSPDFRNGLSDPFGVSGREYCGLDGVDDIHLLIYDYIHTYLQEDILTKVDRASMAHALEVRAPFLDHAFGEFVASIPSKWKLKGITTKYILKKAMVPLLPTEILQRKKKGFGIPKSRWLRTDLKELLESLLSREKVEATGIFSYPVVRKMMDEHFGQIKDHQKELWTLLMFELWRCGNNAEIAG